MGRLATATGVVAVLGLTAATCTGEGEADTSTAVVTTTTEVSLPRLDDGVLTIGALIPTSDTGVGVALEETFRASVAALNDAGGVLGLDVELVVQDEGSTSDSASQAVSALADAGVDAIIGPTSSNNAIGALAATVANGLMMCSPTASAIALDDFPDDGLFFRSIATDSLQAVAIAQQAQLTGASNIAIAHVGDSYGRPYADAVAAQLDFAELTVVELPVDDDDLDDEMMALDESGAPVLIILGSSDDTAVFLEAVGRSAMPNLTDIIVNDAARGIDAAAIIDLPDNIREMILGVAPEIVLRQVDPEDAVPLPFAPQVADCVNLIALSALQANTDTPEIIATQMSSVSSGGSVCRDFAQCATRLTDQRQIDYNGPTGITELGRNGDPSRSRFDLFRFDEEGDDVAPQTGPQQFVADFDVS